MTKIAIQPNASGTGTFTLTAPDSNDNRTFTLPDATGEVLTDQSDIETQVKTATNASGSAPIYACRAWVNFDGTLTSGNIRASGNVSSVTRTSTGFYTVNFTTAMPDADYSVVTAVNQNSPFPIAQGYLGSFAVGSVVINVAQPGTADYNASIVCVTIFR